MTWVGLMEHTVTIAPTRARPGTGRAQRFHICYASLISRFSPAPHHAAVQDLVDHSREKPGHATFT